MVFQSYALFPHLTVAANILFGLHVRRVSAADCRTRLARVAELLGLSPLLARKPSQLSGGQQQRVALGRAIINEAPVCLMDEPLSNLDAQLRAEMRLEIRALQRKLGITMVYVTHDQVEAMSMADRVILLNGGRIEQNGTPIELYEQPANAFVARFIGTPPMNLIEARLERGSLRIGERTFSLPAHLTGAASGDQPVLVGIRPNALTIVSGHDQALTGTVALVEHVGAESVIDVRLDHATTAHREEGEGRNEVMITESGYSDLHANDVVSVAVDLSEAVLFSPESGLRLRPASQGATARRVN